LFARNHGRIIAVWRQRHARSACLPQFFHPLLIASRMNEQEDSETIRRRIVELQLEHEGLDAMIDAVSPQGDFDDLQLRRLKKRRLQIRDTITLLQMRLVPDVPA
jgi:hypothetical protein